MKSALKAENQRVYGEDLLLYIRTNGRYSSEFKNFAFESFRDIAKKPVGRISNESISQSTTDTDP